MERGLHGPRYATGLPHLVVPLGDAGGYADDVHLLERVGADHAHGDLTGERHQRAAVQLSGGDAGDYVCGAWSAGHLYHAGPPGGPGVAVGHVGAPLLVDAWYVAYVAAQHLVAYGY